MVKNGFLHRWGPVIVWAGVIFGLSSIPTLPRVEILWWDFILKKSAHVIEYAVLFYLLHRTGLSVKRAFLWGLVYAASDEIHQRFVPGRTSRLTDVGVDALGMWVAYASRKS
ncbi:MAG: VanZ family protein [Candidatus Chisholmbacteria bacterium]|nr:VanZ family protein [Candidatus Chisholmbacteria bacterium]